MAVEFRSSADKHRIPREDALYAMLHAEVAVQVEGQPGEDTRLFIGHPHGQTDRYIEVIAAVCPPRGMVIFHVMPLRDMYQHLLINGEDAR